MYLRSLQHGVVVMGLIDAFVYAHHQHTRNIENPGNFGDCMKRRIRFMTAITSAYAHAYQITCLTGHMRQYHVSTFACRSSKPDIRVFLTFVTQQGERGIDFQGWTIFSDGSTRHANGETLDLSMEE